MGPVARAVLFGCLLATKWVFWLAAGLLLILVIVQYFRGDPQGAPGSNLILAAIFAGIGLAADIVTRRIAR